MTSSFHSLGLNLAHMGGGVPLIQSKKSGAIHTPVVNSSSSGLLPAGAKQEHQYHPEVKLETMDYDYNDFGEYYNDDPDYAPAPGAIYDDPDYEVDIKPPRVSSSCLNLDFFPQYLSLLQACFLAIFQQSPT